jgi:cytochrome c biogenesis protein CcmG, thiol:disulfide interchange protein DsbE
MRPRVVVPVLAVLAVLAVAVAAIATWEADTPEVIDFGAPPPEDAPVQPADTGLAVEDAPAPAGTPPPDADLAPATWPEAAAWIRRETDQGRPVVMNLFASWCIPCRREMPMLLAAADDNPELAFLGVATNDTAGDARGIVDELGISIPTLLDTAGDDVAYEIAARGMPTTVTFDAEGRLVGRVVGELTERSLEELLDTVR